MKGEMEMKKRIDIEKAGKTSGNWSHLSGMDWSYLLQYQPRFADKCDWSKLDGYEWTQLLRRQPQFADKCDWSMLDGYPIPLKDVLVTFRKSSQQESI